MAMLDDSADQNEKVRASRRARLDQWLRNQPVEKRPAPTIPRRVHQQHIPLSFQQQRLWLIEQLEPGNIAYNVYASRYLYGGLNVAALEQSINTIIQRHEVLRTTFVLASDGQPVQVIAPQLSLPLPIEELSGSPDDAQQSDAVERFMAHFIQQPFNLEQGPLFRACLLRLQPEEHILLLCMHHTISDGWSFQVFTRELMALYEAAFKGQPSPLPELPFQYADYALWQREWLQGEVLEKQRVYWKNHLAGVATLLNLPTDSPRPALQSHHGTSLQFTLPSSVTQQLKAFCAQAASTPFQVLLAIFQLLLARYSGQHDFLIGTPIANRTQRETENLLGAFVNTLVLRASLYGNPTFQELVHRVREETLEAYAHQDIPFERLVEMLQKDRDLSRNPLFQVMFALQSNQQFTLNFANLETYAIRIDNQAVQFDLNLSLADSDEGIKGALEYNTDLFDAETARRMIGHFQMLLESALANPTQHVRSLSLLTANERRQLLVEWNDTAADFRLHSTYAELFSAQVRRTPDAYAVSYENVRMTYRELHERSNQLAHLFQPWLPGAEALIGLYMERSPEMLVAILATFKAGAAYVPLDPAYPEERLALILHNANPAVIVTQPQFFSALPASAAHVVSLDATWQILAGRSHEEVPASGLPEQLAYVIYTSGSTGQPKGAMVTQKGMLNHLYIKISDLHMQASDRMAQTASHCFDISIWQFLSPLLMGGQVHIFPDTVTHDPEQLLKQIAHEHISLLEVVPSFLQVLLDVAANHMGTFASLRCLVVTGEALSRDLCQRWLQMAPAITLVNAYGPTECSDDVTHASIENASDIRGASAPVGRTQANTHIYILDEQCQPVPIGIPGQLYIGGEGVGRGYLNDPERTAAAFVPDHFSEERGRRLYQTGDLARYLLDGTIEFLGRIDHQVKLRGFRIELGEIEAALSQMPHVHQCVVLLHEDAFKQKRLVAYIVPQKDASLSAGDLRRALQEHLPEYMVPAAFMLLPALPLTPNGKIDRQALPEPEGYVLNQAATYIAPHSSTERTIAHIWQEVLHTQRVGMQDNFFDIGGHSLLVIQVHKKLREMLPDTKLTLIELFKYPTVSELAGHIDQGQKQKTEPRALAMGQDRAQSRREALKRLRGSK